MRGYDWGDGHRFRSEQHTIACRLIERSIRYHLLARVVRQHQRTAAKVIDQPWNAPGELGDTRDEIACKQIGPGIASELESMPNIRLDFGGRETLEMGHYGDPLTYVGSLEVEAGLENLLASKDRLDAVPAVIGRLAERDEVAQQRRGTVIGLVNQNGRQRISASGAPASADSGDELSAIFRFARNAQFLGPPIEDIVDAGSRLR